MYKIIRFFQYKNEPEVIKTGLTLAEAQKHCQNSDTEGEGFFDGFVKE